MAVGQNSIKRASAPKAKGTKEMPAAPAKPVAAAGTIAAPSAEATGLFVDQEDGINAHYGVNTPLPTFLL